MSVILRVKIVRRRRWKKQGSKVCGKSGEDIILSRGIREFLRLPWQSLTCLLTELLVSVTESTWWRTYKRVSLPIQSDRGISTSPVQYRYWRSVPSWIRTIRFLRYEYTNLGFVPKIFVPMICLWAQTCSLGRTERSSTSCSRDARVPVQYTINASMSILWFQTGTRIFHLTFVMDT